MTELSRQAGVAYSGDDSAAGNALLEQAKGHILNIDDKIDKIVDRVEQQSVALRNASTSQAQLAVKLAIVGGIGALALAFLFTALTVRSITGPLKRLDGRWPRSPMANSTSRVRRQAGTRSGRWRERSPVARQPDRAGPPRTRTAARRSRDPRSARHGRGGAARPEGMLAHSREGGGRRESVDLNALVANSLNLAYHGARAQDPNLNIHAPARLWPRRCAAQARAPRHDARVPQPHRQWLLRREQAAAGYGRRGVRTGADGDHPRPRRGRRGPVATTARASPPRSRASSFSLSSPPSRPAKAPGSAFRSATTSSRTSTAARSALRARGRLIHRVHGPPAWRFTRAAARRLQPRRREAHDCQHPDHRRWPDVAEPFRQRVLEEARRGSEGDGVDRAPEESR